MADRVTLRLVFVEGQNTSRGGLAHKRAELSVWGYWFSVASTVGLLVYLGFLA
jgi:hypothetical protein